PRHLRRADSARDRIHVPVCDIDALTRDLQPRAGTVHGRAADLRRIGARADSAVGGLFLRSLRAYGPAIYFCAARTGYDRTWLRDRRWKESGAARRQLSDQCGLL